MRGALLIAACLGLALIGCRNQGDHGEELSYVRTRPDDYEPADTSKGKLLPMTPGTLWQYRTEDQSGKKGTEELVALPGGIIETRIDGKVTEREIYRTDKDGIFLVGVARSGVAKVTPALPLFLNTAKEGEILSWQGTVGSGKGTATATAWIRITRRERVKVPAGEFLTWRVDMRTELMQGRTVGGLLVTRWFAPGVGVVRLRIISAKNRTMKELVQKKTISPVTSGVK